MDDDIYDAIQYWLKTRSNDFFTFEIMRKMVLLRDKYQAIECDYRTGDETYGYDPDTIHYTMEDIGDRMMTGFRLQWLVEGIEKGYI